MINLNNSVSYFGYIKKARESNTTNMKWIWNSISLISYFGLIAKTPDSIKIMAMNVKE